MKTSTVLFAILVVFFGTCVTNAFSLNSIAFNDGDGPSDQQLYPPPFQAAWRSIRNITDTPIECSIYYYDLAGNDHTPVIKMFMIVARQSIGWRPVATDTNKVPGIRNAVGLIGPGTVTITWTTGTGEDLIGVVRQLVGQRNSTYSFAMVPAAN